LPAGPPCEADGLGVPEKVPVAGSKVTPGGSWPGATDTARVSPVSGSLKTLVTLSGVMGLPSVAVCDGTICIGSAGGVPVAGSTTMGASFWPVIVIVAVVVAKPPLPSLT
jgi:hypothetical protein